MRPTLLLAAGAILSAGMCCAAAPVPKVREPEKPLDNDAVSAGDTVYMVWDWSWRTRVIQGKVGRGLVGIGRVGLRVEWEDPDPCVGVTWTAIGPEAVLFKTEAGARAYVAKLLRARAAELTKRAEQIEKGTEP